MEERGGSVPNKETLASEIDAFLKKRTESGTTYSDVCSSRSDEAVSLLTKDFPYLGTEPFTDSHWQLVDKCISLSTIQTHIPSHMMTGIENVAGELMSDLTSGKMSLGNLDVESIGKKVLSSVSKEDINSFAQNIDKISSAMRNMH